VLDDGLCSESCCIAVDPWIDFARAIALALATFIDVLNITAQRIAVLQ